MKFIGNFDVPDISPGVNHAVAFFKQLAFTQHVSVMSGEGVTCE